MKPATCCICGKAPTSKDAGDWVEFRDYDKEDVTDLSHPIGLEYFCNEHIGEALSLTNINSADALNKLKAIYPCNDIEEANHMYKQNWWKRWLGLG